jgi:hypothetical protein
MTIAYHFLAVTRIVVMVIGKASGNGEAIRVRTGQERVGADGPSGHSTQSIRKKQVAPTTIC